MTLDAVGIAVGFSAGPLSFLSPCMLPRFAYDVFPPAWLLSRL